MNPSTVMKYTKLWCLRQVAHALDNLPKSPTINAQNPPLNQSQNRARNHGKSQVTGVSGFACATCLGGYSGTTAEPDGGVTKLPDRADESERVRTVRGARCGRHQPEHRLLQCAPVSAP
ncbi:hypothetical protein GQ457_06G038790 [Hibiscus cannabinus]